MTSFFKKFLFFIVIVPEVTAAHKRVLHLTLWVVFALTHVFSELVLEIGVEHERHSSSSTACAIFGKSGGPAPSGDINWGLIRLTKGRSGFAPLVTYP